MVNQKKIFKKTRKQKTHTRKQVVERGTVHVVIQTIYDHFNVDLCESYTTAPVKINKDIEPKNVNWDEN